jgi:hypothetical protein
MIATPPSADTAASDPCEDGLGDGVCAAAEMAARHSAVLRELAEIGMDLARLMQRRAMAEVEAQAAAEPEAGAGRSVRGAGGGDLGLGFSRIARAVRQTLALEAKLEQDHHARGEPARAQQAKRREQEEHWQAAKQAHRTRRQYEISEIVEQAIEAEAAESDVERLLADLDERLADEADDADFGDRPIGEIVARICADLGLTPDWGLWEYEDWAMEEAETKARGSPYARRPKAPEPDEEDALGFDDVDDEAWPVRDVGGGAVRSQSP